MTKIRLTIIALAFGLLALAAGYGWYNTLSRPPASQHIAGVKLGGPFTLTDQNGRTVTEAALKGKWTAIFFGYTYCPDVCPLTLQNLAVAQQKLGGRARDLQIMFVTVDPARDTPENLKTYLDSRGFPSGVIGLTGTQAQVDQALTGWRVAATRVEDKSGDPGAYTFSHTSAVYLMDPDGQFYEALSDQMTPEQNAGLIKDAMQGR